ncbi:hypothetical protein P4U99_02905 [Brevibacillus agri]|uniref:XkdQ/YqbQ family protein n=1 Tax=Brevibacillus agri TaxID=51101 RepID=UPI002E230F9B|nr:hypothetical protein [Brevibacillus agri]MED1691168.1 hypothetical protein [Brevibacillus agri]MED1699404.1 hypothetical protein [Brevibacillus agri]MED1701766.1 hypothetical protein [Brevibacillus agri]
MTDLFALTLIKNAGDKSYDITPLVGSMSWDSNLSLMSALEFDISWTDAKLFPVNPCELGDVVLLFKDGKEVYRGVIISEGRSGRQAIKYRVYDYAWYLGRSKSVYQFNKISASQAILKILKDFGMLVGKVPDMNTIIDDIFLEKSPAEIIETIYKRHEKATGKRYNVEMREGKIFFEEMKELVIKGTFKLADNIAPVDILANPLGADRSRSIEEMRNRVKILIERDDKEKTKPKYEVVAVAQDESAIMKYGLLEETFKIEAEDAAKGREVARILLQRLNRIHETNSLKVMGDVAFKAGRLWDVTEPVTGMKGRFMIIAAKHEVKNQVHTMELTLALPEDVK